MPRDPSRRREQVARSTRAWRAKRKAERTRLDEENDSLRRDVERLAKDVEELRREVRGWDESAGGRWDLAEHALFLRALAELPAPSEGFALTRGEACRALDDCRLACLRLISESQSDASFLVPRACSWPHAKAHFSVKPVADGCLVLRSDWELVTARSAESVVSDLHAYVNDLSSFRALREEGVASSVPGRVDKLPQYCWIEAVGLGRRVEAVNVLAPDCKHVQRAFLSSQSVEDLPLSSLWPVRSDVDGAASYYRAAQPGAFQVRHGVGQCATLFRTGSAVTEQGHWRGFEGCVDGVLAWDVSDDAAGTHSVRVCTVRRLPVNLFHVVDPSALDPSTLSISDCYVRYMRRETAALAGRQRVEA